MTPHATAEKTLSRSHGSDSEALDSLAECVLTTDVDGRIVDVNLPGEQLTGKPPSQILGRTFGDLIELADEGGRKAASDLVRRTLTTGAHVTLGRRGMLRLRGKRRRVLD